MNRLEQCLDSTNNEVLVKEEMYIYITFTNEKSVIILVGYNI